MLKANTGLKKSLLRFGRCSYYFLFADGATALPDLCLGCKMAKNGSAHLLCSKQYRTSFPPKTIWTALQKIPFLSLQNDQCIPRSNIIQGQQRQNLHFLFRFFLCNHTFFSIQSHFCSNSLPLKNETKIIVQIPFFIMHKRLKAP